jgi:hypothetical protein
VRQSFVLWGGLLPDRNAASGHIEQQRPHCVGMSSVSDISQHVEKPASADDHTQPFGIFPGVFLDA